MKTDTSGLILSPILRPQKFDFTSILQVPLFPKMTIFLLSVRNITFGANV